jgi:OPT family oligopeptide transporter
VRAFSSVKGMKLAAGGDGAGPRQSEEVPIAWFWKVGGIAALLCVVVQRLVFDMPIWQSLLAIALSALMALVAARAQGETDVNPIGGMGKVTQLLFALIAPGNAQANLMAAGITSAGANNCGDMLLDMKTGRLLGASPRKQFLAQMFGILSGGLITVFVFVRAFPLDSIGTRYPAPAVVTWRGMAEVLTKGLGNLPPYTTQAILVAAVAAVLFTLAAELLPVAHRKWVPSPTGVGLAFILPASNSYTFLLGAILATLAARHWPQKSERYTIAIACGLIAGASIMGVCIAVYTATQAGH